MRSAFALLALAGLSQAKVFLFNAEKCNTNFDNEANWNNVRYLFLLWQPSLGPSYKNFNVCFFFFSDPQPLFF